MIERLLSQMGVFHRVTVSCERCDTQTPLAYLHPYARTQSFVCERCLVTMPTAEFRDLVAAGREFA